MSLENIRGVIRKIDYTLTEDEIDDWCEACRYAIQTVTYDFSSFSREVYSQSGKKRVIYSFPKLSVENMLSHYLKQQLDRAFHIKYDVYETVCSFSNRYGGYIIMGVEDGGKPIGINKKLIKDMKKNFVNQLNNPDKMSPTLYLSIEEIEYEGMTLLWVFVPPTSTVEKCANRIYDRNEDGDMDITDSPIQLQNLYNKKSNTYAERKIFPYVTTADLRLDLLEKVRNLAKSKKPGIEGKYR